MSRRNNAVGKDPPTDRRVSILAPSEASLQEIACLLAREGVTASRATVAVGDRPAALQQLQAEPDTEVIVLVEETAAAAAIQPILAQVKRSDKPTVVCLLGADPRSAWRAGAIPARRLDEAARRAAAWIRGWDQALVSSLLQEEDDRLLARARELLPSAVGRGDAAHILAPAPLCREAQLMIAEVAGNGAAAASTELATEALPSLMEAASDRRTAVAVLTMGCGEEIAPGWLRQLTGVVREARAGGLLIFAHLYGPDARALGRAETLLDRAGATVAASNAAAARLAGLVLRQMATPDRRG